MILDEIAAKTRERVSERSAESPPAELRSMAESLPNKKDYPFKQALSGEDISFICEVKKASPSKGVIAEDFPYIQIARDYESAGASAISCLTERSVSEGDRRRGENTRAAQGFYGKRVYDIRGEAHGSGGGAAYLRDFVA